MALSRNGMFATMTMNHTMEITFLGHASFRIKGKKATLVTDPYDSEMVGLKYPKVSADIVTISHAHADHNKKEAVKDVKRYVEGPGEYEIAEVSIFGYPSYHDDKKGSERGPNTIYKILMEEISVVHLGDLGHKLPEKLVESLGDIDILLIPVGGEYTIDAVKAAETVRVLEPKIIIPMHYQMPGLKKQTFEKLEDAEKFTKELGLPIKRMSKLSIKSEDFGEDQKVVILEK